MDWSGFAMGCGMHGLLCNAGYAGRSSILGFWYTRCLLAADPCLVRGRFAGDLLKYFDSLSVLCSGHAQLPVYQSTQSMGSAAHSGVVLT